MDESRAISLLAKLVNLQKDFNRIEKRLQELEAEIKANMPPKERATPIINKSEKL